MFREFDPAHAFIVPVGHSNQVAEMCGIIGFTGDGKALEILLKGLRRLEYRGYDS